MIVDVHTHTPSHEQSVPPSERVQNSTWRPDRVVDATASWEDYSVAAECVDVSIVFNIAVRDPTGETGLAMGSMDINDATARFVAAERARRIGFMSVHPDNPKALQEMERCHGDLGLVGVKLGPNYQNFDPLGSHAERVFAFAEDRGLPILFHQGTSPIRAAPLRYAHPLVIDDIAMRHPELRIVMAHMGHPWQTDTIAVVRKHPNVYADVSAQFYRPLSAYMAMRLATEWGILNKLLLGSDFPIATPRETIDGLRGINDFAVRSGLPPVPSDAIEAIINRDALACLGLQDPRAR